MLPAGSLLISLVHGPLGTEGAGASPGTWETGEVASGDRTSQSSSRWERLEKWFSVTRPRSTSPSLPVLALAAATGHHRETLPEDGGVVSLPESGFLLSPPLNSGGRVKGDAVPPAERAEAFSRVRGGPWNRIAEGDLDAAAGTWPWPRPWTTSCSSDKKQSRDLPRVAGQDGLVL